MRNEIIICIGFLLLFSGCARTTEIYMSGYNDAVKELVDRDLISFKKNSEELRQLLKEEKYSLKNNGGA